jgi:hypothetical protein
MSIAPADLRSDLDALTANVNALRLQLNSFTAELKESLDEIRQSIGELSHKVNTGGPIGGGGNDGDSGSDHIHSGSRALLFWHLKWPTIILTNGDWDTFIINARSFLKDAGMKGERLFEFEYLIATVRPHLLGESPTSQASLKHYAMVSERLMVIWRMTTKGLKAGLAVQDQLQGSDLPPALRSAIAITSVSQLPHSAAQHITATGGGRGRGSA